MPPEAQTVTRVWWPFLGASGVMLAFLGLSMPFVRPGTGAYVMSVLSAAMLTIIFVGSAFLLYVDWDPFSGSG